MTPNEAQEDSTDLGNFSSTYDDQADASEQLIDIMEEQTDKPLSLEERNKLIKDLQGKLQLFKVKLDSLIEENSLCGDGTKEFGKLYASLHETFSTDNWLRETYSNLAQFIEITPKHFSLQTEIHRRILDLLKPIPTLIKFLNNFTPENQLIEPAKKELEIQTVSPLNPIPKTELSQQKAPSQSQEKITLEEENPAKLAHNFFTQILNMYEGEKNVHQKVMLVYHANEDHWSKLEKLFIKYPEEREGFKKLWNECGLPVKMADPPDQPAPTRLAKIEREKIEMMIKRLEPFLE